MAAEKIDLDSVYSEEYIATAEPRLMRQLKAQYLTISGKGSPGGENFVERSQALTLVAQGVRLVRKATGQDFEIYDIEALLWGKRRGSDFSIEPRDQWNWKLLVRMPRFVRETDRVGVVLVLIEKGKDAALLNDVKLEDIKEGLCVQMLHKGPYEKAGETLAQMRAFAAEKGLSYHGLYHAIFRSDPRRVAPDKLVTILRMPVR